MSSINEQLRSLILECLRDVAPNQLLREPFDMRQLQGRIANIAQARHLKTLEGHDSWIASRTGHIELHTNLLRPIADIVWDLIIEGVLRIGSANSQEDQWPYLHVTSWGAQVLEGIVTPYDPDGYITTIRKKVASVDPTIITYLVESAQALRVNCLLSSTITLGCASEKAFLQLLESFEKALNQTDRVKFESDLKKARSIKLQHEVFTKWHRCKLLAQLKATTFHSDRLTEFESALEFVFHYFRNARNDAGHPTGSTFSREEVHSHLMVFPSYLAALYNVIAWLNANGPLS